MPPTSRARRRPATRGVATVEVLVAVAVVVLIGAVALLGFGGGDRARLDAEAARVALVLQQTRLRALETGRPVEIVLADGVLAAGRTRHVVAAGTTASAAPPRAVLHPSGESDAGFALTLRRDALTRVVELDWLTGRVTTR